MVNIAEWMVEPAAMPASENSNAERVAVPSAPKVRKRLSVGSPETLKDVKVLSLLENQSSATAVLDTTVAWAVDARKTAEKIAAARWLKRKGSAPEWLAKDGTKFDNASVMSCPMQDLRRKIKAFDYQAIGSLSGSDGRCGVNISDKPWPAALGRARNV